MQKRVLKKKKKKKAPENCHRLQCKSLFNVADLVNGMWKVAPENKKKIFGLTHTHKRNHKQYRHGSDMMNLCIKCKLFINYTHSYSDAPHILVHAQARIKYALCLFSTTTDGLRIMPAAMLCCWRMNVASLLNMESWTLYWASSSVIYM